MRAWILTGAFLSLALGVSAGPAVPSLDEREKALLAQPESGERAFELAEAYRAAGELQRGIAFLGEFHKTHSANTLSLVWQGSLKTAASAKGDDMEQRLDLLQSGIADMDRAVALFPKEPRVLLVRAITMSHFPGFLGMQPKAIHDLEAVLGQSAGLTPGALAAAREALARLYRDTGRPADAEKLGAGSTTGRR